MKNAILLWCAGRRDEPNPRNERDRFSCDLSASQVKSVDFETSRLDKHYQTTDLGYTKVVRYSKNLKSSKLCRHPRPCPCPVRLNDTQVYLISLSPPSPTHPRPQPRPRPRSLLRGTYGHFSYEAMATDHGPARREERRANLKPQSSHERNIIRERGVRQILSARALDWTHALYGGHSAAYLPVRYKDHLVDIA